jgi:hypothetical protein
MATIAEVRALLGDQPQFEHSTASGDGASKTFLTSKRPLIVDSESVTVSGSSQTKPTDYTIDYELGLITFVNAPSNGAAVVSTFQYAEISDEMITTILGLESNAYLAAAAAARAIAGRYASQIDKQVGDLRLTYSQRAKAWSDLSKTLTSAASRSGSGIIRPWAGGISRSDKRTYATDTDLVQPAFTRDMQETPGSNLDLVERNDN